MYGRWVGVSKYEAFFNKRNKIDWYIEYEWDEASSKWIGDDKREYAYDGNGNRTSLFIYNWNNTTSKWIGDEKFEYTWDSANFISNLCGAPSFFNSWVDTNIPIEYRSYEWNIYSEQWSREFEVGVYYYSPFLASAVVNPYAGNAVQLIPNPVKDKFQVNGLDGVATVILYDMNGREVYNQTQDTREMFSVKHLISGVYLVRISKDNNVCNLKLLKH